MSNPISNTPTFSAAYLKTHCKYLSEQGAMKPQYGKVARRDVSADPDSMFTV